MPGSGARGAAPSPLIKSARAQCCGQLTNTVENQGPDLQNILRQSYDYLTMMPKLRSTYDGRLICRTFYKEREAFLRYDSLAKS